MKIWCGCAVLLIGLMAPWLGRSSAKVLTQLECTGDETFEASLFLSADEDGPFSTFKTLTSELGAPGSSERLIEIFGNIHALQSMWWNEIEPSLSECEQQAEVTLLFGRLLDETLIFASMTQTMLYWSLQEDFSFDDPSFANYTTLTHDHGRQVTNLQEQIEVIISGTTQQANGEGFAICVAGDLQRIPQCFFHLLTP